MLGPSRAVLPTTNGIVSWAWGEHSRKLVSDALDNSSTIVACCMDQSSTFCCLFATGDATDEVMPHCRRNKSIMRFLSPTSLSAKNSITSERRLRWVSILTEWATNYLSCSWAVPSILSNRSSILCILSCHSSDSLFNTPVPPTAPRCTSSSCCRPSSSSPSSSSNWPQMAFCRSRRIHLSWLMLPTPQRNVQFNTPDELRRSKMASISSAENRRDARSAAREAVLTFTGFDIMNIESDSTTRNFPTKSKT